jgi:hypothetical protein
MSLALITEYPHSTPAQSRGLLEKAGSGHYTEDDSRMTQEYLHRVAIEDRGRVLSSLGLRKRNQKSQ